jgi:hypothetical protein
MILQDPGDPSVLPNFKGMTVWTRLSHSRDHCGPHTPSHVTDHHAVVTGAWVKWILGTEDNVSGEVDLNTSAVACRYNQRKRCYAHPE